MNIVMKKKEVIVRMKEEEHTAPQFSILLFFFTKSVSLNGGGAQWTIYKRQEPQYLHTIYRDETYKHIGNAVEREVLFQDYKTTILNLLFDLGLGVGFGNTRIELLTRYDFFNGRTSNLGMRIRQQIFTSKRLPKKRKKEMQRPISSMQN